MKQLYDKPWKIWSILGTVVTTAATIGYTVAPVESKIILDTLITLIEPLLENSK